MATENWLLQPFMSSFHTNKLIVDAIKPVSSSKLQWKATRNNYSLRPRTKIEIFPWRAKLYVLNEIIPNSNEKYIQTHTLRTLCIYMYKILLFIKFLHLCTL